MVAHLKVSERLACRVLGLSRTTLRYLSKRPDLDQPLLQELLALKAQHPRWGHRKLHRLLQNQGWEVNRKRVLRLWRQNALQVRRRAAPPRRAPGSSVNACDVRAAEAVNHVWSMDFVSDTSLEGRSLKFLTVVDEFSREALRVEVGRRLRNSDVGRVLSELISERGRPGFVRSDNGSEFIAKSLQRALKELGCEQAYIAPGSPWQNGKNERFNGILREELLSRERFYSLREAQVLTERFRLQYNNLRPHGALQLNTPNAFALQEKNAGRWFRHHD